MIPQKMLQQGFVQGRRLARDPLTPAEHLARLQADLAGAVARGLYPGGPAAYRATLDRVQEQVARLARAGARPQAPQGPAQQADCGGGIYSWNASLHLLHSTLTGNIASLSGDGCGGGVFVGQSPPAGVLIQGNTLRENIASGASMALGLGGGVYAIDTPGLVVANNIFQENNAMSAGLVSSGEGGGLFVDASPDARVSDNHFVRNTANAGWEAQNGLGGGALLRLSDGAVVSGNEFRENLGFVHAQGGGGGLAVVKSAQVTLTDNDVTGNWGGIINGIEPARRAAGYFCGRPTALSSQTTKSGTIRQQYLARVRALPSEAAWKPRWGSGGRIERNEFSGNVASQTGIGRGRRRFAVGHEQRLGDRQRLYRQCGQPFGKGRGWRRPVPAQHV